MRPLLIAWLLLLAHACGGSSATQPEYGPLPPDQGDNEPATEPTTERPSPELQNLVYVGRPGFVRIEGRWLWTPTGWVWQAGNFVEEREGYVFVQGRWGPNGWVEGRWIEGVEGQIWQRGYWDDVEGKPTWVPGKWISRKPGQTWERGRWEKNQSGWRWRQGHWRKNE